MHIFAKKLLYDPQNGFNHEENCINHHLLPDIHGCSGSDRQRMGRSSNHECEQRDSSHDSHSDVKCVGCEQERHELVTLLPVVRRRLEILLGKKSYARQCFVLQQRL